MPGAGAVHHINPRGEHDVGDISAHPRNREIDAPLTWKGAGAERIDASIIGAEPPPIMRQTITKPPYRWHNEILAGLNAACVMLPISLSAGVLVYAPLGPAFIARGAAAGLLTAVIAGALSAVFASSSFIITGPLASASVILAALPAYLMTMEPFSHQPDMIMSAVALCVLVAGLLQAAFGLLGVGRIIKFTPHSVIAGFTNSIGLLIILSQLRSFFSYDSAVFGWIAINRPTMLAFVLALAASIVAFANLTKKVPALVVGLVTGSLIFYGLRTLFQTSTLGPTIGNLPITLPPLSPLLDISHESTRSALLSVAPQFLLISLTLAVVTTLQALLAFRVAQNLADLPPRPPRDLMAQGIANSASALAGGIVSVAGIAGLSANFRAGGRTRLSGLAAAVAIFIVTVFFSQVLARIPIAVLSGILVSIGYQLLDRWTFRLPGDAVLKRTGVDRRHAWQNLSVVALVMAVSIGSSIVAGAIAGFALSCFIFILDMARPIVRRSYSGDEIFSKRERASDDMAILLRTGRERVVLELQGVLFFGNGEALSSTISDILKDSKMVLLDLRGVSDVDVSGAAILANLIARASVRGKRILLCNLRKNQLSTGIEAETVLPDLDSGLQWMEDQALRAAGTRPLGEAIPLAAHELTHELDAEELATLALLLIARGFEQGSVLCNEGEDADRMWLLTKGTVSVRLRSENGPQRVASYAAGTTFGEMALLAIGQTRSATVTADENISTYELSQAAFDSILQAHPKIAAKLLKYFAREMARRLRFQVRPTPEGPGGGRHHGSRKLAEEPWPRTV